MLAALSFAAFSPLCLLFASLSLPPLPPHSLLPSLSLCWLRCVQVGHKNGVTFMTHIRQTQIERDAKWVCGGRGEVLSRGERGGKNCECCVLVLHTGVRVGVAFLCFFCGRNACKRSTHKFNIIWVFFCFCCCFSAFSALRAFAFAADFCCLFFVAYSFGLRRLAYFSPPNRRRRRTKIFKGKCAYRILLRCARICVWHTQAHTHALTGTQTRNQARDWACWVSWVCQSK